MRPENGTLLVCFTMHIKLWMYTYCYRGIWNLHCDHKKEYEIAVQKF